LVGESAEPEAAEKEPEAEKPVVEDEVADAQAPMHRESAEKAEEGAAAPAEGDAQLPDGVRASPLARRIAEEKGIDLRKVDGSGPRGRIVKKDVETFSEQPAAAPAQAPAEAPKAEAEKKGAVPPAVFTPLGPPPADEEIPLSRLRAAIGRRMVEASQQVPHFYVTHEYNMAPVMALRKQINGMLGDDEKLSVNDFIIKAAALALRQFPNLNASLAGDKVIRHGQVNMGVAVAVEGGLLTVVCRDADRKSLRQISTELQILVGRAREGKVRPDDIEGSTFSISNMGMLDVESFTAIINPPEAAILAVGSARELPVVEDGEIKPGIRMKITISVDHRVSDGAEAARYMQALEAYLHEPLRMML
ncbi:MAG TPA: dihydrolipoamide acetyltransferase family protein, partial [Anaerolineales bacterium]|nr:dihydrolipoamide acetyltransferase family protein [Anaerolineales bacterium]